jgi:hypothetical protein
MSAVTGSALRWRIVITMNINSANPRSAPARNQALTMRAHCVTRDVLGRMLPEGHSRIHLTAGPHCELWNHCFSRGAACLLKMPVAP